MDTDNIKEQEEQTIEITEEELAISSCLPLTYSLANILAHITDEDGVNVTIGANALPCIDFVTDDIPMKLSFFPTENLSMDMFVLLIRAGLETKGEEDAILACESFNTASLLGYAVYVGDGIVELRAQVPHEGKMYDNDFYRNLIDMYLASLEELQAVLQEG